MLPLTTTRHGNTATSPALPYNIGKHDIVRRLYGAEYIKGGEALGGERERMYGIWEGGREGEEFIDFCFPNNALY